MKPKARSMKSTMPRSLFEGAHKRYLKEAFTPRGEYTGDSIPRDRGIIRDSALRGARGWKPEALKRKLQTEDPRTARIFTSMSREEFEPKELMRGMRMCGVLKKNPKAIVFAGYTGQYSKALQDAGISVMHTDALEEYAKHPGIPSMQAPLHLIPTEAPADFTTSFEGYNAISSTHGYYGVLRSLANWHKGMVIVAGKRERSPKNKNTIAGTHHSVLPEHMRRVYGIRVTEANTKNLLFTRLFAPARVREKIAQDLEVLKIMQDTRGKSAADVARRLGIPEAKALRSLKRLHYLFSMMVQVEGVGAF